VVNLCKPDAEKIQNQNLLPRSPTPGVPVVAARRKPSGDASSQRGEFNIAPQDIQDKALFPFPILFILPIHVRFMP
jgi:hypothetical protein